MFNPNCVILDNADHGGATATLQLEHMLVSNSLSINDLGMATVYVEQTVDVDGQVTFEESITANGVISASAFGGNLSGSVGSLGTQAKADVKAEAEAALQTYGLDHLIASAVETNFATTVHLDSVIGHLADTGTSATFDRTTDSLEAQRNNLGTAGAALSNVSANVVQFGGTNGSFDGGRPAVNTTYIAGSVVNTGQAQLGVNLVNAGGAAISASGSVMAVNTTQLGGSAVQQDSGYIKVSQGVTQGQLDLTNGRIGVDWAKVSNQGSTVALSGTTIKTTTDVETDTQDIQSKIGTPSGASVSADIAAIKGETAAILDDTGTSGVKVASNGLTGVTIPAVTLANGAHGGSAATLTAERIIVASTTSNEPAVKLTGNGSGAGLAASGGASGNGATLQGGASGGAGLRAVGQAGVGISASGGGSANPGISANGGTNAAGIAALGGSGTGHGIAAATIGSGHGIYAIGGSAGNGAMFQGSTTGSGMALVGGTTGSGLAIAGGSTSGDGVSVGVTDGDAVSANVVEQVWTGAALPEAYAAQGAEGTPAQLLYMLLSAVSEFEIVSDEIRCKDLGGTTQVMKFILNSATNPTSRSRDT
ncbi:MAG: hypothetical protein DCC68_00660 [Planctomycetota bacterium]|nr:MAG: hypothetical protein DCC68_00660 [Planctomycetota bacterium]